MRSLISITLLLVAAVSVDAQTHHRWAQDNVWSHRGNGTVIEISDSVKMRSLTWQQAMLIIGPDPNQAGSWRAIAFVEQREAMNSLSDPPLPILGMLSGSITPWGDWTERERVTTGDLFPAWSPELAFGHVLPEMAADQTSNTFTSPLNLNGVPHPVSFEVRIGEAEAPDLRWSHRLAEPTEVDGLLIPSWSLNVLWDGGSANQTVETEFQCALHAPEERVHTEAAIESRVAGLTLFTPSEVEDLRAILQNVVGGNDVSEAVAAFHDAHPESPLSQFAQTAAMLPVGSVTTPE